MARSLKELAEQGDNRKEGKVKTKKKNEPEIK